MAFSFPAFSYIVALIVDAFLIFFSIFHVIAFDELKTDYKNPIDQCNSLNPLVLPEYLLHLFINLLFLLSGEWFSLLINIPLILYHIHRYYTRPVMSGPGLYDPTSIMNADVLTVCQREGWIKLALYLLSFFLYLYGYTYIGGYRSLPQIIPLVMVLSWPYVVLCYVTLNLFGPIIIGFVNYLTCLPPPNRRNAIIK